jgi:hypothetical protein
MSTTIITALYDIGRDNLTGRHAYRPFSNYLLWFKNILAINVPMIIYIPQALESYVREHRSYSQTQIMIIEFHELPAYKYHNRTQDAINNMRSERNMPFYFNDCPEFITAKYEVMIFSKFGFLKDTANRNPFNTEYFIWLDAGTYRDNLPFNSSLSFPHPYKVRLLEDKFLVYDQNFNVNNKEPLKDKRNYLRRNQNEICAYILGGNVTAVNKIYYKFWSLVDDALNMGVINNEQHLLQLMILEDPDDYFIWNRMGHKHTNFAIPTRDRMIPYELSLNTHMSYSYRINSKIKLLTIATKELDPISYQRWELTAKYYGYNYEILGRDEPWKGFNTKIRLFHERLSTINESYAILSDCTDLFFCGSSDEAYDKFLSFKQDIVIGGELEIYCPGSQYSWEVLIKCFSSLNKDSPYLYPNSGFIMGKTSKLLELMDLHMDCSDDQTACFRTIMEKQLPITIDYYTKLIGNIPNYGVKTVDAVEMFTYDPKISRYVNKTIINPDSIFDTAPIALHFPGKNIHNMERFYNISQSNATIPESTTDGWGFILIIVIIIIIIVIGLIAWLY